jgi:hypothetical protein
MKEHPIIFSTPMVQAILEGRKTMTRRIIKPQPSIDDFYAQVGSSNGVPAINDYDSKRVIKCPFGQPGNLLYVRETYCLIPPNYICYKASNINVTVKTWKPSIHMPKSYARIWLKVVNVRVERLQDISSDDARKGGIKEEDSVMGDFRPGFLKIWDKIYGPESWNENPWVWVVEFEMVEKCALCEKYTVLKSENLCASCFDALP